MGTKDQIDVELVVTGHFTDKKRSGRVDEDGTKRLDPVEVEWDEKTPVSLQAPAGLRTPERESARLGIELAHEKDKVQRLEALNNLLTDDVLRYQRIARDLEHRYRRERKGVFGRFLDWFFGAS